MNVITDLGGGEMSVRMTNSRFARPPIPAFFTGWTTLRLALYLKINDSGANITGTPLFGFGLCSGGTNILGDATTDHFVGALSTDPSWTRTSATHYPPSSMPVKMVGTTITPGSLTLGLNRMFFAGGPTLLFVDITKGSPNFSLRTFAQTATTNSAPTLADFLAQTVAAVPAYTGHAFGATRTVAVDEATDGTLDHACVWWNQTIPTMDIAAWKLYRLA